MLYFLGCPIWANKDWVGELFSADAGPSEFLRQYASVFNTVEGNGTFYGLPGEATIEKWCEDVPDHFRFCFKFPRSVSHEKKLFNAERETVEFLQRLKPLGSRLGPFFLQLPPGLGPGSMYLLDRFLESLPSTFDYAVEVRHPEFFRDAQSEFSDLLKQRDIEWVIFDTRGIHAGRTNDPVAQAAQSRKPKLLTRKSALTKRPFVRFVGYPEVEDNEPLLREWVSILASWVHEGRVPYFFAHAPNDFFSPHVARLFHALLQQKLDLPDVPQWPAESSRPKEEQLSLF